MTYTDYRWVYSPTLSGGTLSAMCSKVSEMDMPDRRRRGIIKLLAGLTFLPGSVDASLSSASSVQDGGIAATEWLPLEMLLTLGIAPLAVSEAANYMSLVQQPPLPAGVIELGLRTEPNVELLAALRPSLIVYAEGYGPTPSLYDAIAPTLGISFSDRNGRPLATTSAALLTLGDRVGRSSRARDVLSTLYNCITSLHETVASRTLSPILFMALVDARHALVFGKNSLFLNVMDKAGIRGGWQGETNFWGSAVVGIERLSAIRDSDVYCFTEQNDNALMEELSSTALWKAMPFVRSGRFHRVPGLWYYGGPLTAMRFCHLLKGIVEKV
jgi:ferric hydroxamate transport system substrate-binding protein